MQFSKGFALYIAVCNSPAAVQSLIAVLQESMPEAEIETVELDENVEDPLARVLALSSPGNSGPLMVVGLERSCPSADPDHPVLHVLNLQRPEWPKKIPRSVVLWIPEYLLSLMGAEAPDFLDWRSDTLFFPSEATELHTLASVVWMGGGDGRMPEQQRRARIEELQARLRSTSSAVDPVVLSARSSWLNELGNHRLVLGQMEEAGYAYEDYLENETRLGRRDGIARGNGNLGVLALRIGNLKDAEERIEQCLSIAHEIDDRQEIALAFAILGLISLERDDLARARELLLQAMDLFEEQGSDRDLAISYGNLALISLRQERLDEAVPLLLRGIELSERIGDRMVASGNYQIMAEAFRLRGDYAQAEEEARKSLAINEDLHDQASIAADLAFLSGIYREQGDLAAAREYAERARNIYQALGIDSLAEALDAFLSSLPTVST